MEYFTPAPVLQAMNMPLNEASKQNNSVHDYLASFAGEPVSKTLTCDGNGAQNDNIFTVTGSVEVVQLWAECTESTDSTTLSLAYFDLYDGAAAVEITDNGGTNLSGIAVGGMIFKDAAATVALTFDNNATGVVSEGGGVPSPFLTEASFRLLKKTGQTTYIRFNFTGDANTDVDLKFYIRYVPRSSDGAITAV